MVVPRKTSLSLTSSVRTRKVVEAQVAKQPETNQTPVTRKGTHNCRIWGSWQQHNSTPPRPVEMKGTEDLHVCQRCVNSRSTQHLAHIILPNLTHRWHNVYHFEWCMITEKIKKSLSAIVMHNSYGLWLKSLSPWTKCINTVPILKHVNGKTLTRSISGAQYFHAFCVFQITEYIFQTRDMKIT